MADTGGNGRIQNNLARSNRYFFLAPLPHPCFNTPPPTARGPPKMLPQQPFHLTPTRYWAPLNDLEWAVLLPYVFHRTGPRVKDLRQRLDAMFWMACQPATTAWAALPAVFGKPDTVSRQFRRWAHAGTWMSLLQEVGLVRLASWICRAFRRATRIQGLRGILLARRLGLMSALRGPPHLVADPELSEHLLRHMSAVRDSGIDLTTSIARRWARGCRYLLRTALGRGIPRALAWP